MNVRETIEEIRKNIKNINFESAHGSGNSDRPYIAKNLISLRDAINSISNIPFIQNQINALKSTPLFENYKDEDLFTFSQNKLIAENVDVLKIGLTFLLNYYYASNKFSDDVIHIKLPEVNSFEDLNKLSNDLKRAIELPVNESNTGGRVNIETAESGSIWLVVSLGSIAAVNLVAGICWAAAVIKKKNAEAKIFEAHAKTLDLKNEAIELLVNAQKAQLENILSAEAEAVASKHFDHSDPETINRLKLSISTIANLIERGTKILPNAEKDEIKNLFPDYTNLNLISSSIKQLKEENN